MSSRVKLRKQVIVVFIAILLLGIYYALSLDLFFDTYQREEMLRAGNWAIFVNRAFGDRVYRARASFPLWQQCLSQSKARLPFHLVLSKDWIYFTSEQGLSRVNLYTKKEELISHLPVQGLSVSPSGDHIAVSTGYKGYLIDAVTGEVLGSLGEIVSARAVAEGVYGLLKQQSRDLAYYAVGDTQPIIVDSQVKELEVVGDTVWYTKDVGDRKDQLFTLSIDREPVQVVGWHNVYDLSSKNGLLRFWVYDKNGNHKFYRFDGDPRDGSRGSLFCIFWGVVGGFGSLRLAHFLRSLTYM